MSADLRFTFEWYHELLGELVSSGLRAAQFTDPIGDGSLLLRHDVDWSPRKAVRLAEIEADNDLTSTYFFMTTSPFYNVMNQTVRSAMDEISALGHTVGLHFSTHQYWPSTDPVPARADLTRTVEAELRVVESATGAEPEVVSFHNPPDWVLKRRYDGFVSTYEPRFFEEILYRADSDQRWREEPPFVDGVPAKLQLLTHPVLWGEHDARTIDRLREERQYHDSVIESYLTQSSREWAQVERDEFDREPVYR